MGFFDGWTNSLFLSLDYHQFLLQWTIRYYLPVKNHYWNFRKYFQKYFFKVLDAKYQSLFNQ